MYEWAGRMVRHFARRDSFDQDLLLEIVTGKLFDVSRDSARLGPMVFLAFERWLRFSGSRYSAIRRLKLMAKSIMRYGQDAHRR